LVGPDFIDSIHANEFNLRAIEIEQKSSATDATHALRLLLRIRFRLWSFCNIETASVQLPSKRNSIGIEMKSSHHVLTLPALLLTTIITPSAVQAQAPARVGEAVVVHKEVVRVLAHATSQINVGDGVVRDETVRTGLDSATRLVLADSTNLSLGASASITLDRTVFDDEHKYRDIAINMTSGAFRFVTGHSEKAAYKITTPLATIGVRGTILDILSERGKTTVVLQEGGSQVCTRGSRNSQCIQLDQPGDTATITSSANGRRTTIGKSNTPTWTFAAACTSSAGLCSVTDLAQANAAQDSLAQAGVPPAGDDPGMLCGR
jgi:hypothetical protein